MPNPKTDQHWTKRLTDERDNYRALLVQIARALGVSSADDDLGALPERAEELVTEAAATKVELNKPEDGDQHDAWEDIAAQHLRNEVYYRGLLERCAAHLGPDVFVQDDGGVVDEPLVSKVPKLVERLAASLSATTTAEAPFHPLAQVVLTKLSEGAHITEHEAIEALLLHQEPLSRQGYGIWPIVRQLQAARKGQRLGG